MRSQCVFVGLLAVLLGIASSPVHATLITVGDASNVATSATVTASSAWPGGLAGSNLASVTNNIVENTYPDFDWTQCYAFDFQSADPYDAMSLDWTTPQNLSSLQAYVTWDPALGLSTSAVTFYVRQQGSGEVAVGTVSVPATPSIGYWSLVQLDGSWSNVDRVSYWFTAGDTADDYGPRVAEVLAITSVPEPSTMALTLAGLIGLLAYAWRKRR